MIIVMKQGKGALVRERDKIPSGRPAPPAKGHGLSPPAMMEIFDDDLDFRQVLFDRRLQISQSQRLKPYLGIVKILNGGLDKKKFHCYTA